MTKFDLHRPYENKHQNDAYELTVRVFRDCAEQLDAIAKLPMKPATRRRLERGSEQIMKLREMALDVIRDWEPDK
jgi:hypothetical protein